jgi:hypothetical protein
MCRRKKKKVFTKEKKKNEFDNQKEIHRLINIANEIVNKRRIKLSGWMELAIAIRHLS